MRRDLQRTSAELGSTWRPSSAWNARTCTQHFFGDRPTRSGGPARSIRRDVQFIGHDVRFQQDGLCETVLELCAARAEPHGAGPAGRAVTFNNLACYYRRQGEAHAALSDPSIASTEGRFQSRINPAGSMPRVRLPSQLGRHQSAARSTRSYCYAAKLQEELLRPVRR